MEKIYINDEIIAPEVRLIGQDGEQLGVVSLYEAKELAYNYDCDLIMVSSSAMPPVCKLANYYKYKFEQRKKAKEAKKKQAVIEIKEIQLSCRIDTHDLENKIRQMRKFLAVGNKVRLVVRFRGREAENPSLGFDVLNRCYEACSDIAQMDKPPKAEGRNAYLVLSKTGK